MEADEVLKISFVVTVFFFFFAFVVYTPGCGGCAVNLLLVR